MDYSLIGKIEKAKIYAEEKDRVRFLQFKATVHGENHDHLVTYDNGEWGCDCDFFGTRGYCSHSMAMERILGETLPNLSG